MVIYLDLSWVYNRPARYSDPINPFVSILMTDCPLFIGLNQPFNGFKLVSGMDALEHSIVSELSVFGSYGVLRLVHHRHTHLNPHPPLINQQSLLRSSVRPFNRLIHGEKPAYAEIGLSRMPRPDLRYSGHSARNGRR
jgi:hypothetical protein